MADELEILGGMVVVHSHLDNPCSRCGAIDIHSLEQCSTDTLKQVRAVLEPEDSKGRTRLDNPPACGASPNWRWGYLPCGCHNDGYGRHVR